MLFKDVIGQEATKQRLRRSVQEGRTPHAQLFTGCSGVGKLPLALAYAQYLNCPNRTDEDSCGTCPSCLQYQRLQHPDLHFVFPIVVKDNGPKEPVCNDFLPQWRKQLLDTPYFDLQDWYKDMEAEKKQGMIYERESSEILRKLSLKPFSEGKKVMIIWQPEKMNDTCSNKLLKILEEPPTDTIFLLVSEEPQRLLQTILSRVQEVHVPTLPEEEIAAQLRERLEMEVGDSIDIAHIANGSWLTALQIASGTGRDSRWLADWTKALRAAWMVGHKRNYDALLELRDWATHMAGMTRDKQKEFLGYCQIQIRENFIQNYNVPEAVYQTPDEKNFSSRFAPFIHAGNVEALTEQFALAERQITQNGNAGIVFFDLALQLIVLIKK